MSVERFLAAFGGRHVFCVIDDKRENKAVIHFHEGYDLTREDILQKCSEANERNWGIFFCVNEIDREQDPKHKRTSKMLTKIRAIWADDDTPRDTPREDWPLEPNITVETSPGKYHYYWLTTTDDTEQWAQVMAGIVNTFDTDVNSRDLVRVLRVPGFNHCKKEPFAIKCDIHFDVPYLWSEIIERFPLDTSVVGAATQKGGTPGQTFESFAEASAAIRDGSNYHGAIMWLLNHWVNAGITDKAELDTLVRGMLSQSLNKDGRWEARTKDDYLSANIRDALNFVEENPIDTPVVSLPIVEKKETIVDLGFPPGQMGQLCSEIYEMAPHPNEEVALMAAFALVAGVVGRRYNVSGDGLNLYMALLADSGIGKATLKNVIHTALIRNCTLEGGGKFVGPSRFTGPKAVFNSLQDGLSRVCVLEEAGLLDESKAGDQAGLTRVFLDLYTSSGRGHYAGGEHYSKSDDTVAVLNSPALTLAHVSTPTSYIRALKQKNAALSGGIARVWMIRSIRPKAYINEDRRAKFSPEVINRLKALVKECAPYQSHDKDEVIPLGLNGVPYKIDSDGWVDIENQHKERAEELERTVASRAFMKTLKIASVGSVFNGSVMIEPDMYAWAKDAIEQEVRNINEVMLHGSTDSIALIVESTIAPVIGKIIADKFDDLKKTPPKYLKGKGIFTLTNLKQALRGNHVISRLGDDAERVSNPKDGFQKIIDYLLREGMIVRVSDKMLRQAKARTKIAYRVTDDFRETLTQ